MTCKTLITIQLACLCINVLTLSLNGMFTYTFETAFIRSLYFEGNICTLNTAVTALVTSTRVSMFLPACGGFYDIR
jgi:hypothetical protein